MSSDINQRYLSLQKQHQEFVNHLEVQTTQLEQQVKQLEAQLQQQMTTAQQQTQGAKL